MVTSVRRCASTTRTRARPIRHAAPMATPTAQVTPLTPTNAKVIVTRSDRVPPEFPTQLPQTSWSAAVGTAIAQAAAALASRSTGTAR